MKLDLSEMSVAESLAVKVAAIDPAAVPVPVRRKIDDLIIDIAGLCLAARNADYVKAALDAWEENGPCTVIGHDRRLSAAGAAFVNGTAAHGEDFDDTFEGGPVHAGAVIVPAVLAACERFGGDGRSVLVGIAAGVELICRLSLVAPGAVHQAGFHPTAVFGVMAAAGGAAAALGLPHGQMVNAFGIAGSMAGGIIEYLAEGAWTKRMHAGWAAQSGLRAALLARAGFIGPRTVFEGVHGLFRGFAPAAEPDYDALLDGFGSRWVTQTLAFKPYPCGTMTHPYIDCARRLASLGLGLDNIVDIACEVAEGTVHRLWEPLASKQHPPNGYAGKFSTPYCIAAAFIHGDIGLASFTDGAVRDERVRALASKIRYQIDPDNPYPKIFTGHIRARLADGRILEERQSHLRGGAHAPLTGAEIEDKFASNARHGGWDDTRARQALPRLRMFDEGKIDLKFLQG